MRCKKTNLWIKLNNGNDVVEIIEVNEEQKTVLSSLTRSALFTTLRQEIDRFNQLLGVIGDASKQLRLAVSDNSLMTDNLDEMYAALLKHKVPQCWKVGSAPVYGSSCTPLIGFCTFNCYKGYHCNYSWSRTSPASHWAVG